MDFNLKEYKIMIFTISKSDYPKSSALKDCAQLLKMTPHHRGPFINGSQNSNAEGQTSVMKSAKGVLQVPSTTKISQIIG